ncbi:MAG: glycosyltransferase family 4 protein [Saprospiraceae bacterium]|nr:glycosyltransferase family 4 protein [Saprospiraceae bacterium]
MKIKKNIGIIVDNDFDLDIRVRKEIEILKKSGHSIHILCFAFDEKKYNEHPGITVHRIRIKKRRKEILQFILNTFPFYEHLWKKEINSFIVNYQINILHVHDLYMSRAAHLGIKASGKNIPMILDLHENFAEAIQSYNWTKGLLRNFLSKPKAWISKEKEYLSYPQKLIVLSDSFKEELINRYTFITADNILSFPNVIDLRRFEKFSVDPSVERSDRVTLMYFGVVGQRRGIFETLDVFGKGIEEGLPIDLLIIGPVDKADKVRFFNEINNPKLKKFITHVPWIELSDLVTYMHISDIFLSPLIKNKQHESGVANKIFQYMYGAKPIIVSDCKPQKDLIESVNCGLAYSTQEEFLACITTLVNDQALRKLQGTNGRQKLYEKYDNPHFESQLLNLYQDLL